MIHLKNLTKVYPPSTVAIKDVTLDVEPGEFVSIVGQSGCGKSTLVKLLMAEERPTEGEIVIGGWNITHIKKREIPVLRKQIGVIFQDFKLLPKKTAFENIRFALEVSGHKRREIDKVVHQVLGLVSLRDQAHQYPNQLSGGEQQRVAIARSLVHRPKLLMADEPTGNLDAITSREIIDLLQKINDFGTTVLLVSHDREIVNNLRRRVITLDHGHVISDQARGKYVL
ncbi:MAG: cell division ATP-binding protein FtsE [Candidatus Komeilibacteria bacterium RIFCSPLOWO2_01_FULL_52_15]|uniref:Cell division ATP-binding protein FtsE n=2 Tax=Candidatus Komeiliibacteriota TaxID=1817908 RepID=A0A1G2BPZ4_9BACT|nr:MAG: cell division ATP-binding protein FtsE [Candidatus Komeilibacteria bacterium RIFCSPLOWO2_01_FULL_52_15]